VLRSGVTSLAKSLWHQLAPENIRINNLMPGRIDTDRVQSLDAMNADVRGLEVDEVKAANELGIPVRRYGNIEEFGGSALFCFPMRPATLPVRPSPSTAVPLKPFGSG
jgi:3-oxoacyl-[acyl-carrier protein] reductase